MAMEIRVPTLGESVTEATIAQWYKKEGEAVNADEPLVELETDKVSVDVPAPTSGVLKISAKDGDTVEVGALLGNVNEAGSASAAPSSNRASTSGSAPAASGGGEIVEVRAPSSGESVTEAEIGEWFKKVGDAVAVDEAIVSLETDKAAMDVGAPVAGVITEIAAEQGAVVEVGALLAKIQAGAAAGAVAPQPKPAAASQAAPTSTSNGGAQPLAPSVQRIVSETKIDPTQISGSGKGGRVTKGDALQYLEARANAPAPQPGAKAPRDIGPREERVPMSRLRRTIATRLKEAQSNAAMLTTFNELDMSSVMTLRKQHKELFEKKHGVKLGFMSFFVKACVHALKELPAINAEIDGGDIIYKNFYDIGVAVGTDKGLVVPVVRDADALSLAGIEKSINDYGRRAREGSLKIDEMQGGTFTISNGGVYGSMMSTPILNAPQSGILGMHNIVERAVVINGQVEVRPMMYLALSYDHRIVDGKEAVTFLVRVKESLEDPQRLLLDL